MPVFRLDSDTAAARGAHARILAAFGEAESGVLVGTQMVAKGHDFPEVTLSAILDADATLRFPDFRAERAHLRAGRPARRPQRPRRGRGGGDRPDPGPEAAQHRPRRRATTPPASSPASSSAAAALALPALLAPGPDRAPGRARGAGSTRPPRRSPRACAAALPRRLRTCSARRRCSASATATAAAC